MESVCSGRPRMGASPSSRAACDAQFCPKKIHAHSPCSIQCTPHSWNPTERLTPAQARETPRLRTGALGMRDEEVCWTIKTIIVFLIIIHPSKTRAVVISGLLRDLYSELFCRL